MKKFLIILPILLSANNTITKIAKCDVDFTIDTIMHLATQKGMTVFKKRKINNNSKSCRIEFNDNRVGIVRFWNPRINDRLLREDGFSKKDLSVALKVYKDKYKKTKIEYTDPDSLKAKNSGYILEKIDELSYAIDEITNRASSKSCVSFKASF